jgi:PAS domain S-box-containing protein
MTGPRTPVDFPRPGSGEHAGCFYVSDAELLEFLSAFIREGLSRREQVLLLLDPATADGLPRLLEESGPDPGSLAGNRQLRIVSRREPFRKDGSYDPERTRVLLGEVKARALAEGYSGLRTAADMAWLLSGGTGMDPTAACGSFPGVCLVDCRAIPPAALRTILASHAFVAVGGGTYPNPYHVPRENLPGRPGDREMFDLHLENIRLLHRYSEAENALRESRKRYRDLIETVSDWVWEVDENAVYTYASPKVRDLLGYDPDEVVGKTPFDLMPPSEATRVRDLFLSIAARREPFSAIENVNRHRDGRLVVLETSGAPFFGEDGTFRGYRGVDRDIGERKRVEEELRRNEERLRQYQKFEALGRLSGGLAHHLNNMMTVVTGYSDLLLSRLPEDDPRRRDISRIRDAGERAAVLTREMLAFGRRQVLRPQVLDVNAFLAGLARTLSELAGPAVRISIQPGEGVGNVRLDPDQFRQALANLASNARDAMPGGGELSLSTEPVSLRGPIEGIEAVPGRYVLLSVKDNGDGMDAQTRANVFEPFYTTKKGSDGMGLPSVYGFVKQSGGYIFVDSVLGRGSTFRLYLPCTEREEYAPGAGETRKSPRGKALVVTDEEMVRMLLSEILEHAGFEVLVAGDDREVLAALGEDPVSVGLLVADMDMAGGNAADLVRRVLSVSPVARVMLLSAYLEEELFGKRLSLPGHALVRKPFSTGDFLARLERLLSDPPGGR